MFTSNQITEHQMAQRAVLFSPQRPSLHLFQNMLHERNTRFVQPRVAPMICFASHRALATLRPNSETQRSCSNCVLPAESSPKWLFVSQVGPRLRPALSREETILTKMRSGSVHKAMAVWSLTAPITCLRFMEMWLLLRAREEVRSMTNKQTSPIGQASVGIEWKFVNHNMAAWQKIYRLYVR